MTFMIIAGEASGDALAGELVTALRSRTSDARFFGVGGEKMAAAGVEIIFDLTKNAVFGAEAFARLLEFRRRFKALLKLAIQRRPDAIICVDFAGFNLRFAHAVKEHVRARRGAGEWSPKVIQYVSPQVWASRPGRAKRLERDVDLLLTIFPFEKQWYADRAPSMPVEFVGHPVVERFSLESVARPDGPSRTPARLVILPGSRPSELRRHLPVLSAAVELIRKELEVEITMVLAENLFAQARAAGLPRDVKLQSTGLAEALAGADAAIAKSGTITLECAVLRVPTVAMYKTSWLTYEIAKLIVSLRWIAMPNILANEEVFPEFVQHAATPENISRATLEFLNDSARRTYVRARLDQIVASLGAPGAAGRAAQAILRQLASGTASEKAETNSGIVSKGNVA